MNTPLRVSLTSLRARYRQLFSIIEIETSQTLQWFSGAMVLYFLVTFATWVHTSYISAANNAVVCWPYLQDCADLLFLKHLGAGYSQNILYMVFLGVITYAAHAMWKRNWVAVHACIFLLWIWKVFAGFVLSFDLLGMYDYYHLALLIPLLFFPFKEYFAKAVFVMLYFVSATIKIYPSWIAGTYFSSLAAGLPLVPDALIPFATNIVVLSQVVGCWFLLSENRTRQWITFLFFEFFHFYSGFFVAYMYPLIAIPALTILFGPLYRYQRPPLVRKAVAGWALLAVMLLLQLYTFAIPGDQKITLEGYRYGAWMFDANHQCVARLTVRYPASRTGITETSWQSPRGSSCIGFSCLTARTVRKEVDAWIVEEHYESPKAWSRCSPYAPFVQYQRACADATSIAMTFDHSINGGPFFRIVDETNICTLSYAAFWHNSWIKEPPEAPIIGYPVENAYAEFTL